MITLYRAPFSTNVERVALALAHKGIAAESVWIEYSDRTVVERVSGQGLVPVIDYGGTVVADSTAILEYLEERHPDPPLYPRDPARREEMRVFIDWFNLVWKVPPNAIEAELRSDAPDREKIETLSSEMRGWLDRFEALLDGRDYLMSEEFAAADCVAFPFLKYALGRDPEDPDLFHHVLDEHLQLDGHDRVLEWIGRVDERPRA